MSSLVYTNNNNNNNNNNLKIDMTGNGAAHHFPIVGINSATKMYRYQNIVPAPTVAATAQTAATTTTTSAATLATSGCGKIRKYSARSGDNTTNGIISNNTNASLAANSAPYNIDQSQSVQRRNARERNRVKQVNNSFARLRQHIPQSIIADLTKGGGRGPQKKISKVDTLRIAVEYIRRLQDLVEDLNGSAAANNGGATNNVTSFSAAAAALLPSSATSTLSNNNINNNLAATTTNNFCNNNNLASTPPPINSTSPLPLMLSNTSSPLHNSINNGNISIAISALQQQQQLTRQQYPNHPLTPISLNAYSPPPAALSTQTQLDQHVGCHSPTSSFNSSMSFDSGTFEAAPQQLSPLAANTPQQQQQHQQQHQHLPTSVLELPLSQHIAINQTQLNEHHAHLQLKFEPHEHFNLDEEDCTPDDEEILDYISLWQEQ